jgi:hypothetical protein
MTLRNVDIDLEYAPVMNHVPTSPKQLHDNAAANDDTTVEYWRPIWIRNQRENHEKFGPFKDRAVGSLFGQFAGQPTVVAGSGPSLALNADLLKDRPKCVRLISCLHNFHFFEDRDIEVDYYVSLDAGPVTIEEISEGGQHPHEWYLERSKSKKLLAYVASDPGLIRSWAGELKWFNCPIPDAKVKAAHEAVERFDNFVSNGGNVLGACVYIAKAILGANPVTYVGADFAFGYAKRFHAWDSKYDGNQGVILRVPDVFGNPVKTWPSYNGFKQWHESVTLRCPGDWINCTEGGTFGAYPDGLLKNIVQKPLALWLQGYRMHEVMEYQMAHPECADEDPGVPGIPPQPKLLF